MPIDLLLLYYDNDDGNSMAMDQSHTIGHRPWPVATVTIRHAMEKCKFHGIIEK